MAAALAPKQDLQDAANVRAGYVQAKILRPGHVSPFLSWQANLSQMSI